jgi:hypothetical protein
VRLTLTTKLAVRVTRPEILREYAADARHAMAEALSPDDLEEFAYLAVTSEGPDEIAEDPAGQLRFLLNASDVIGGTQPTCGSGRAHAGGQGRFPGAEHLRGRAVRLEAIMQLALFRAPHLAIDTAAFWFWIRWAGSSGSSPPTR